MLFTSAPKKGSAVTSVSAASASASSASASATGGDSKSEQSKLAQLKATLRILLELTLVGCVPPAVVLASNVFSLSAASSSAGKTGSDQQSSSKAAADVRTILEQPAGFLPYVLRLYLSADREHHVYAPLAVAFARPYCAAVVGTVDASLGTVFSAKAQQWLSGLLDDYYRTLTERLDREHKSVRKIRRYHEEHRITRGELSEAQKSHYDTALKSRELVLAHCHALAAAMGKPPPDISVIDDEVSAVSAVTTTLVAGGKTDGEKDWSAATFEDEDAEQFYTVLLKLDNFVPANYFSPAADKGKSRSGGSAAGVTSNKTPRRAAAYLDDDDDADGLGDTSWMDEVDDEVMRLIESDIMRAEEDENVGSSTAPATTTGIVGRKPTVITGNTAVDDVLSRMSDLITTSAIDEAVVQFCNAQFNCRSLARSYLIKTLVEVPRFRVDLLPYYARFIAILHPHLPEVGATVMVALHSQFRRLFRKPQRIHTEYRTKNVRYFGELAKFQVCPPHVIFYCFRRLVQPETSGSIFNAQHVEVACALLESCGRFMLKTPETSKKFGALVGE